MGFHLSPGQAHDLEGFDVLLEFLWDQFQVLLADKALGSLKGAPTGSSDSNEVPSKATLGVRPRQVPLAALA